MLFRKSPFTVHIMTNIIVSSSDVKMKLSIISSYGPHRPDNPCLATPFATPSPPARSTARTLHRSLISVFITS